MAIWHSQGVIGIPRCSHLLHVNTMAKVSALFPYSTGQISAIEFTERTCSVLSLIGASCIVTTFLLDKNFHKPINRMVFYAAWGNVAANIATLISTSGIRLGADGPLCQFQAFFIQW